VTHSFLPASSAERDNPSGLVIIIITITIATTTTAPTTTVATEVNQDQEGGEHPHQTPSPPSQKILQFLTEDHEGKEVELAEARQAPREISGLKAHRELLALEGSPVLKVPKDQKASRVYQDQKVPRAPQALELEQAGCPASPVPTGRKSSRPLTGLNLMDLPNHSRNGRIMGTSCTS
jgi:hypothetical protein